MNRFSRILALFGVFVLTLGTGTTAIAQVAEDTAEETISIAVTGLADGVLTVDVTASAFTDALAGQVSTGQVTFEVTDGRAAPATGEIPWFVSATLGPFSGQEHGQIFTASLEWTNPQSSHYPNAWPDAKGIGSTPVVVFHTDNSDGNGTVYSATGDAAVGVPSLDDSSVALVPDTYTATMSVSIYTSDPDV